jgi:hypothetical protein
VRLLARRDQLNRARQVPRPARRNEPDRDRARVRLPVPAWRHPGPGGRARGDPGRCDETSCQNWDHLLPGTQPDNIHDYRARRGREDGPLADRRGAQGRATAIRDAILAARRTGTSTEQALQRAINAGIPPHQQRLF